MTSPDQNRQGPGRLCLLALVLLACGAPVPQPPIRDVRPLKLDVGDKMLVEGMPGVFIPGAPTQVVLEGQIRTGPGGKTLDSKLVLDGRAASPERVIVDFDEVLADRLLDHTLFNGVVHVVQSLPNQPQQDLSSLGHAPFALDLFPHSLRRLAFTLVDDYQAKELLDWLGMGLAQTRDSLLVHHVRTGFKWAEFMQRYDRPPLDAKISWVKEAQPAGMPEAQFRAIDKNHDWVITRHEGESFEHPAGYAAQAGLREGDLLVRVAGKPIRSLSAFVAAWKQQANVSVPIEVRRQGSQVQAELPRYGAPAQLPEGFLLAGLLIGVGLLVLAPLGPLAGFIVVWERKISGRMQSRVGPNRVGPQGWLQWLADAIKLIIKEDIVPLEADPILFRIAPYLAFVGLFLTLIVLPMSETLVVADLDIGLLFLLSVTSLVVVSILMGGWASNSKWSLLGGMRSAAQIISYELPASVALLTIATLTGSLSLQSIVHGQGGAPWHWNLFANPMAFICFFIYFISALAEGNRTPFDLPEAESELVSGYNTEYSGFRFGIYPMVEWINLFVISAVATTLFLGGWGVPGLSPEQIESSRLLSMPSVIVAAVGAATFFGSILIGTLIGKPELMTAGFLGAIPVMIGVSYGVRAYQLASLLMFAGKVITLIFIIIWIRWTLPRFRVDQMMNMCWKYFIPISFACFLASTAWVWLIYDRPLLDQVVRIGMFLVCGLGILLLFLTKVIRNLRQIRLLGVKNQIDLNLFH